METITSKTMENNGNNNIENNGNNENNNIENNGKQ